MNTKQARCGVFIRVSISTRSVTIIRQETQKL